MSPSDKIGSFGVLETSLLPVKGCKFLPMLGTYGHCAVGSMPHLLCHRSSLYNVQLRGPVTLATIAKHLAMELSRPVLST